jgi:hypothetical protein
MMRLQRIFTTWITVVFVVSSRQNKSPFAFALGDRFTFKTYFLTGKASPNDRGIIVIVVIIIDEAQQFFHNGGIIAQRPHLSRRSYALSGTRQREWI